MSLAIRTLLFFFIITVAALFPLDLIFHASPLCGNDELPGVSFDLTPDYGTAAVHFDNGSSVAVAKVEGNSGYKAFMRQKNMARNQDTASHLSGMFSISSYLGDIKTRLWKHPHTLWGIDNEPVKPMLQALKAAVESYLGNSICFVNLSLPKGEEHGRYQIIAINKAINQIGLTNVWNYTFNPASPVMLANGLSNFSEPDRLILVIDNSKYGFNLQVFFRDDALYHEIRDDYRLLDDKSQSLERSIKLQRALEDITRPPFGSLPIVGELPDHIEELALYGDDIWDTELRKTLGLVLDAELVSRAHQRRPKFSAALGLAKLTFNQINDPMSARNGNAQFGCCWKSRGKGCPRY